MTSHWLSVALVVATGSSLTPCIASPQSGVRNGGASQSSPQNRIVECQAQMWDRRSELIELQCSLNALEQAKHALQLFAHCEQSGPCRQALKSIEAAIDATHYLRDAVRNAPKAGKGPPQGREGGLGERSVIMPSAPRMGTLQDALDALEEAMRYLREVEEVGYNERLRKQGLKSIQAAIDDVRLAMKKDAQQHPKPD